MCFEDHYMEYVCYPRINSQTADRLVSVNQAHEAIAVEVKHIAETPGLFLAKDCWWSWINTLGALSDSEFTSGSWMAGHFAACSIERFDGKRFRNI